MVDLGVLGLTLKADTTQATKDLNAFSGQTEKTESKLSSFANSAGKVATGAIVGMTTAVVAGTTALVGMATKSAETADRIDKMSAKIGISKEAFQEWDYVMAQNGMDVEKLQVGVKTLTAQMDAASQGTEGAIENFQALGLSWEDSNGKLKDQETMMNEAIMALANMENGTEKARLATELFGKAGIDMMPMLNNGSASIQELTDRAHELGLVMSDETVNAGVVLGDTIDDVKKSFGAIVTHIGAEVMPIVQQLCDYILEAMPAIQQIMSVAFDEIGKVVSVAIDLIMKVIEVFKAFGEQAQTDGTRINEIVTQMQEMFQERFQAIIEFIEAFCNLCKQFWDEWGEYITTAFQAAFEIVFGVVKTVTDAITDLLKIWTAAMNGDIEGMCEGIKELYSNLFQNIGEMFSNWWARAQEALSIMIDKIISMIENFYKTMIEFWKNLFEGIVNWIKSIIDKVIDFGKDMFDAGKDLFLSFWDGLKDVWSDITSWVTDSVNWILDKLGIAKDSAKEIDSLSSGSSTTTTTTSTKPMSAKDRYESMYGSFANGIDYIPTDMPVMVHRGEAIVSADKVANGDFGNNADVVAKLDALIGIVNRIPKELLKNERMGVR